MATFSDYQQRLMDQGASFERVLEARRPIRMEDTMKTAKARVLEIDPKATLRGPFRVGHYVNYSVHDGDGKEIGWTEGNEQGATLAWVRALSALERRGK